MKFKVSVSDVRTVTVLADSHEDAIRRVNLVIESPDYRAGCDKALEEILNQDATKED
jgi:predicted metal-dependent HD superfamily phosphohydrolase